MATRFQILRKDRTLAALVQTRQNILLEASGLSEEEQDQIFLYQELLASAKASQEKLVGVLQTVPPEHFNRDFSVRFRGYKVTIQRLLEAEEKDEQTHLQQILGYFKK